jgi:hypothetical protein
VHMLDGSIDLDESLDGDAGVSAQVR